ncbi:extracellular solute-binding protein [Herbiconiux sp. CPCC 203407]|uniref:Extracellular solute-binding protein n=1 Tax=Herbiconiux oxytropis TaxID=2970915 RepID=A0AA41XGK0_9MICO|nr:extracellular solute-binding protein [Herbiconiux oxytropis]MCS5723123.1 extracellular solute-binding protein [Herbiconiux oxytropis]MCS5725320.1 extracellular solute-binding protein [Herbiconiux oxytropis]
MTGFRGITWDHPRGRNALEAAARSAASGSLDISWSAHSLEHFESHPIDDLAANYDLIVLDHPHLGEALEKHSLQPLDAVVGAARIERWSRESVGPSFDSYSADGYQWAVPLDAATQVAVHSTALLPAADVPATWSEVEALALSGDAPVALSLAGPHAFLSFASIAVALGEEPGRHPGERLISAETGAQVLELMRSIASRAPEGADAQNPIALLERLSGAGTGAGGASGGSGASGDIAYIPLVYGYVTYSSPTVRFADAPTGAPGGRRGSTIGGTGLAVSARAEVTPALIDHIDWLMSGEAQRRFIPQHDGQPSARAAWEDDEVNAASHDFYRATLRTIDESWVRPRYSGYIPFQSLASALVRDVLAEEISIGSGLSALQKAFDVSNSSVTERV